MTPEELHSLADRLDAAEYRDYDTDGPEYTYYAEGQGDSRVYGSSAADFIRQIAKR